MVPGNIAAPAELGRMCQQGRREKVCWRGHEHCLSQAVRPAHPHFRGHLLPVAVSFSLFLWVDFLPSSAGILKDVLKE